MTITQNQTTIYASGSATTASPSPLLAVDRCAGRGQLTPDNIVEQSRRAYDDGYEAEKGRSNADLYVGCHIRDAPVAESNSDTCMAVSLPSKDTGRERSS